MNFSGVWTPRNGTGTLNSPRQVSNDFITPLGNNEETSTLMLMTWGQFITHDLTRATPYTSRKYNDRSYQNYFYGFTINARDNIDAYSLLYNAYCLNYGGDQTMTWISLRLVVYEF